MFRSETMTTQTRWEGCNPPGLELTEVLELKRNFYWIVTSREHKVVAVEQATDGRAKAWFLANGYSVPVPLLDDPVPDQVDKMSEAMMRSLSGFPVGNGGN